MRRRSRGGIDELRCFIIHDRHRRARGRRRGGLQSHMTVKHHQVIGEGSAQRPLSGDDVRRILHAAFDPLPIDGQRVLVIIPDGTRTMPMPMMFSLIQSVVGARSAALDYLVALGTHQPMSDAQLSRHVGQSVADGRVGRARVFNHQWADAATFVSIGTIRRDEVALLSRGLIARDVDVALNRRILDYDHLVICGPVFPHEVAGFSGGAKYFFPGIAGPDIIDFTHWLGALMTSPDTIGTRDTPVRAVIERAASFIGLPTTCISLVVTPGGGGEQDEGKACSLAGLFIGPLRAAWEAAADLSARTHIVYVSRPFSRVLSVMPAMYTDLWTAAKGMYKLEPAVADGGEVVIYAPHITEVSHTHGRMLDEIGYHCRDYFVAQWARFGAYPGGVLAHSTHLKGLGTFDAASGIETARVNVTLATGIPEARCRRLNLGYMDPATVRLEEWENREDAGILVVRRAGEMLYRLSAAAGVSEN
jgi:nickel-dependent lactate racemase